jgi:hypothetical protein
MNCRFNTHGSSGRIHYDADIEPGCWPCGAIKRALDGNQGLQVSEGGRRRKNPSVTAVFQLGNLCSLGLALRRIKQH